MTVTNGTRSGKPPVQQALFSESELDVCEGFEFHLLEYAEPKNDAERLFNIQADYIRTRSDTAYAQLWLLVEKTAENIIYKIEDKKKFRLQPEEVEDKKTEAALYFMRRYKKNSHYYVRNNFLAAIWHAVLHALYYGKAPKLEQMTGSLDLIDEDILTDENGGFKKIT